MKVFFYIQKNRNVKTDTYLEFADGFRRRALSLDLVSALLLGPGHAHFFETRLLVHQLGEVLQIHLGPCVPGHGFDRRNRFVPEQKRDRVRFHKEPKT